MSERKSENEVTGRKPFEPLDVREFATVRGAEIANAAIAADAEVAQDLMMRWNAALNERDTLRAQLEQQRCALQKAVEILRRVAARRISYYAGPLVDGHETESIKVEERETFEAADARIFLASLQSDSGKGE